MGQPADRMINLFGALAQGVSDRVRTAISAAFPIGGEAAAALIVIGHEPGMSIEQISRILRLSHAGTVRLVERLVAHDLIAKARSASDRRMARVILTPTGEEQRAGLLSVRNDAVAALLAEVPAADRAALERVAETVLTSLLADVTSEALTTCRFCDQERCPDCPMDRPRDAAPFTAAASHRPHS